MGKYGKISMQAPPPPRPWSVHPIWRGIGCLMVLIGPFVAIAAAHILLDMNLEQGWFAIPRELAAPYTLPAANYTITHFFGDLLLAVVFLLIGFSVIMIVYSIIYSIMGPPRYGPLDARPNPGRGRSLRR
jgi:uncharacterized membrane protein YphA (DoxX/SURF4 family)